MTSVDGSDIESRFPRLELVSPAQELPSSLSVISSFYSDNYDLASGVWHGFDKLQGIFEPRNPGSGLIDRDAVRQFADSTYDMGEKLSRELAGTLSANGLTGSVIVRDRKYVWHNGFVAIERKEGADDSAKKKPSTNQLMYCFVEKIPYDQLHATYRFHDPNKPAPVGATRWKLIYASPEMWKTLIEDMTEIHRHCAIRLSR